MANETEKKVYSVGDTMEVEIEKSMSDSSTKNKSVRTRRIVTGAVFSILAFIGVISIIANFFKLGAHIMDDTEEKQKYNTLLNSIVMYDPLPFESPEEADQELLLASTVWQTIMSEDLSQYDTNEYGFPMLPATEVDRYFSRLFGASLKLSHHSFTDAELDFEFDEEKQAYVVLPTTYPSGYTPQTAKIKTSFNRQEKIVTVGYLSVPSSITEAGDRYVVKYVDYCFEKENGEYYLKSVRESDMKVTTDTSSTSEQ